MKITKIDIIPIRPRLASRYKGREVRFQGVKHRTIYKLQTDNGLVGYGDHRLGGLPRAAVEPLIGRDPFDFINNTLDPGLGGALYDLMGKYLDVPAYKFMGQKVRDAVSVAAWTAQSSPAEFASEIERAAAEGYRVFQDAHRCVPRCDGAAAAAFSETVDWNAPICRCDCQGSARLAELQRRFENPGSD